MSQKSLNLYLKDNNKLFLLILIFIIVLAEINYCINDKIINKIKLFIILIILK